MLPVLKLALVSLIGWIVIAILFLAEVNNYMTPHFQEHMVVDSSLGQQLRVNINITFHALTCNDVCFDFLSGFTFLRLLTGALGCNGCRW